MVCNSVLEAGWSTNLKPKIYKFEIATCINYYLS